MLHETQKKLQVSQAHSQVKMWLIKASTRESRHHYGFLMTPNVQNKQQDGSSCLRGPGVSCLLEQPGGAVKDVLKSLKVPSLTTAAGAHPSTRGFNMRRP